MVDRIDVLPTGGAVASPTSPSRSGTVPAGAPPDADGDHRTHHAQRLRDTWPLQRRDWLTLLGGYAVLAAVFTFVGLLITGPLDGTWLTRTDESIERWFVRHRTPAWNTASWWGSGLAETVTKVALATILCVVFVVIWHSWREAVLLAASLVVEVCVFLTATTIVGRPRPDVPPLDGSPVKSSFPSGHTAAAVAFYAALVAIAFARSRSGFWRRLTVTLVIVVPAIVAVSRMYRGMHHLSDVVAGALVGGLSFVVARMAVGPVGPVGPAGEPVDAPAGARAGAETQGALP